MAWIESRLYQNPPLPTVLVINSLPSFLFLTVHSPRGGLLSLFHPVSPHSLYLSSLILFSSIWHLHLQQGSAKCTIIEIQPTWKSSLSCCGHVHVCTAHAWMLQLPVYSNSYTLSVEWCGACMQKDIISKHVVIKNRFAEIMLSMS